MVEPVIDCQHVTFKYMAQAEPTLHDINLKIYPGEKILIAGASGSGKTTLLRLFNGIIPQAYPGDITGQLTVNGQNILTQSIFDLSLQTGTVLQDTDAQFVGLTVAEDIAFAMENDRQEVMTIKEKVKHWAQKVNLTQRLHLSPQALSGGQKQRTALAGVLVDNSRLLLLDEPLASLDPAAGEATMAMVSQIHAENNMTVIIIEHRIEEVLRSGIDRIVLMKQGRIVADDTPENILKANILSECGLDEPLYLQLMRHTPAPVMQLNHIEDVNKIAVDQYKADIEALAKPIRPNRAVKERQLAIKNLSFGYDQELIFNDFSANIWRGEILGIVGKNGSGKTTLSHLLTGFLTPTSGDVILNQRSLLHDSIKERAEHIGYVLQNPNHMITKASVFEEVASGLKLRHVDEGDIQQRVTDMLKMVDLYSMRNWPISALSFGQKKRLTIAAVLVLNPEILILDEPTAGQDAVHTNRIISFLQKINQSHETTIVIITHDMHLLAHFVQRTLVIVDGKLLADTSPAALLANETLVQQANLKTTSIYELAKRLGIAHPENLNTILGQ